jgi:hypothetical protein
MIQAKAVPSSPDELIRQIAELRFQVGRLQTALFEALDNNARRALP